MERIPLEALENQELLVTLADQDCRIALYHAGQRMYLDLVVNNELVRSGAVCLPGVSIIRDAPRPFSGALYIIDTRTRPEAQEAPEPEGLGSRWKLFYLSAAEVAFLDAERKRQAIHGII